MGGGIECAFYVHQRAQGRSFLLRRLSVQCPARFAAGGDVNQTQLALTENAGLCEVSFALLFSRVQATGTVHRAQCLIHHNNIVNTLCVEDTASAFANLAHRMATKKPKGDGECLSASESL